MNLLPIFKNTTCVTEYESETRTHCSCLPIYTVHCLTMAHSIKYDKHAARGYLIYLLSLLRQELSVHMGVYQVSTKKKRQILLQLPNNSMYGL